MVAMGFFKHEVHLLSIHCVVSAALEYMCILLLYKLTTFLYVYQDQIDSYVNDLKALHEVFSCCHACSLK
jgi:hypothetical protein